MSETAFRDHLDRLKDACRGGDIAVGLGLRGKGSRFFCPACQPGGGKTPDLDVFDQGFKCYKCGLTGDVIDLAVLAGRMSKPDAIRHLETLSGIGPCQDQGRGKIARPGPSRKAAGPPGAGKRPVSSPRGCFRGEDRADRAVLADLYDAFLKTVCQPITGSPGAAYLGGRGIAADVADQYGVRYCHDLTGLWALADRELIKAAGLSSLYAFQKADLPFLVFPYIRHGKPVFIKTRCLLSKDEADRREVPRFLNTGGKVPCLWNHDAVAAAAEVLIAEGEIDALSGIMAGLVAVGLPGWSHWKDAWTRDFTGKDVILVLDADEGGRRGVADITSRFARAGLQCPRQLILTEGEDLNDALQDVMKDGNPERVTS